MPVGGIIGDQVALAVAAKLSPNADVYEVFRKSQCSRIFDAMTDLARLQELEVQLQKVLTSF